SAAVAAARRARGRFPERERRPAGPRGYDDPRDYDDRPSYDDPRDYDDRRNYDDSRATVTDPRGARLPGEGGGWDTEVIR
ncbi:hypothetical protein, partial [Actinomadura napierensis]